MAAFTRRFVVGLAATVALGSVSLGLSARDEPAAIPYAVPAAIPPADAVVPVHAIEPVRPEAAVSLEWSGPPVVRLNRPNDYTLTVRNVSSQAVQRVTVQVRATPGATVVADKPAAADGVLLWELPALDAKQSKDFKLRVTPTRCGEAGCQAWVTLTGTAAMKMKVQEPKLTVSVEAPAKVAVGDAVEVKVFARNAGDCAAENVTVILRTPSGDVPVFRPGRATESLWLLADNTTTGSLELFTLIFKIIAFPTIGDTTDIEFTNSAMLPFGTGVYDRPSLAGTITVLTPGTVPIVGSDVLALTALLLLVLSRRSGRKPMAASRVALR